MTNVNAFIAYCRCRPYMLSSGIRHVLRLIVACHYMYRMDIYCSEQVQVIGV